MHCFKVIVSLEVIVGVNACANSYILELSGHVIAIYYVASCCAMTATSRVSS